MSDKWKKPLRSCAANGFKIRGQGQAIRVLLPLGKKSLAPSTHQFLLLKYHSSAILFKLKIYS